MFYAAQRRLINVIGAVVIYLYAHPIIQASLLTELNFVVRGCNHKLIAVENTSLISRMMAF